VRVLLWNWEFGISDTSIQLGFGVGLRRVISPGAFEEIFVIAPYVRVKYFYTNLKCLTSIFFSFFLFFFLNVIFHHSAETTVTTGTDTTALETLENSGTAVPEGSTGPATAAPAPACPATADVVRPVTTDTDELFLSETYKEYDHSDNKCWREHQGMLLYFKKFLIVEKHIENHHFEKLWKLVSVLQKALAIDLRVRDDIKSILIQEKSVTDKKRWSDSIHMTSRLDFFWNWKEFCEKGGTNDDEENSAKSVGQETAKNRAAEAYVASCEHTGGKVDSLLMELPHGKKCLKVIANVAAATLPLLVPLGLAGSPPGRTGGHGTPSLVCMPPVNHRQPDMQKVGSIMKSCNTGINKDGGMLLDDNYRCFIFAKDSSMRCPEVEMDAATWKTKGSQWLKSVDELPIVAQDMTGGGEHERFVNATVSQLNINEKIRDFGDLILGKDAMGNYIKKIATTGNTTQTPDQISRTSHMEFYSFTLENFFQPFGGNVTEGATWQNLYNHLCEKCGLVVSELVDPFCFARLFQRCRLLIQSTCPPIPALIDGMTRTTSMVYYLSGVFKLSDSNRDSPFEFGLHEFIPHHDNLAEPFWKSLKETPAKIITTALTFMGQKIPVTLLSYDADDNNPSVGEKGNVDTQLDVITCISRNYQDQAAKASPRTIKEHALTVLEKINFDPPSFPDYVIVENVLQRLGKVDDETL
jgi:hypothetical protein